MVKFHLDDSDIVRRVCEVIHRGEPFAIVAEGFRGQMAKQIWPFLTCVSDPDKDYPGLFAILKSYFYLFWTKQFVSIFYTALDEHMSCNMEDNGAAICFVFQKDEEGRRLSEGVKAILKKEKSVKTVLLETFGLDRKDRQKGQS